VIRIIFVLEKVDQHINQVNGVGLTGFTALITFILRLLESGFFIEELDLEISDTDVF